MRKIGIVFILIGLIWAVLAFNMDVAVTSPERKLSAGYSEITIPSVTVNNMGLMDQRRNHLIFAGLVFLAGMILFALGKPNSVSGEQKTCPFCAEQINVNAVICRFCQKEVPVAEVRKHEALVSSPRAPVTVKYCPKCTGMNDGSAKTCFRCEEPLEV